MSNPTFVEAVIGLAFLYGLVQLNMFYWPRVLFTTLLMAVWGAAPLAGWLLGVGDACGSKGTLTECAFVFVLGGAVIGILAVPWWIAAEACLQWWRRNPPKHKGLFDRI
jgi:hypothetical protein